MRDKNSPVLRLLRELLAEDSRLKIASVLEEAEDDVQDWTGKGLWNRIECHRSDEACAKMLELAECLLEQLPFPQPFKAEELASALTGHVAGFDPSVLSGDIGDTLFGRILHALVGCVGDTRWLQKDLRTPDVCLLGTFDDLSSSRVLSLRCHVPDSVTVVTSCAWGGC